MWRRRGQVVGKQAPDVYLVRVDRVMGSPEHVRSLFRGGNHDARNIVARSRGDCQIAKRIRARLRITCLPHFFQNPLVGNRAVQAIRA